MKHSTREVILARVVFVVFCFLFLLPVGLSGCAGTRTSGIAVDRVQLRRRAMQCLKSAIQYRYNPAVRAAAVEALEVTDSPEAAAWIRAALLDEHPGVRFAGCVAVGTSRDRLAESAVRQCLNDEDPNVRVGALFAVHRLGQEERTGKLATYLLKHEEPTVRRQAAYVLGLLGEPGVIKALAKAMKDRDKGVRDHALEAMAHIGNADAKQELVFMTETGVGSEEVFALSALAVTRDPAFSETYRYKLAQGAHVETRLAAARGLGLLGIDEGYEIAVDALRFKADRKAVLTPGRNPQGPLEDRALRVRLLAALALGTTGRLDALRYLERLMNESDDPREQVAAAKAILEILEARRRRGFPAL